MRILCRNCRGLGSPQAIQILRCLIRQHNPELVFLMETKLRSNQFSRNKFNWNYYGVFSVDAVGRSGGLALFWSQGVNLSLVSYSQNHITAHIFSFNVEYEWTFIGFYGKPKSEDRWKSWKLLDVLCQNVQNNLLIAGDFNEILDQEEKLGGRP